MTSCEVFDIKVLALESCVVPFHRKKIIDSYKFRTTGTPNSDSTTFTGNSIWNQYSDNDGRLQNFHRPEFGVSQAMFTHQLFGSVSEGKQFPFVTARKFVTFNLISSRQAENDINKQQQAVRVLQRYINGYELDYEHRNPLWGILSSSNDARSEPIRVHSNRGGAHRRWTSRQSNDRCFLQTSGGNIVQEDMARHSIYRNVNYEFPTSFPDQHTAINYFLIGEGNKHVSSSPSTNFSQSINPDFSNRPPQGIVIPHFRRQCHTFVGASHPTPSLPNDSFYVLQREEESPLGNSETQSLSSPYSVVHDLSMNESYSVPEADNLFRNLRNFLFFKKFGVLQRYVKGYVLDYEHRNPQWGILSSSNDARPEPIRAHNNRGGAHRRWTSRQSNDRCFLQTSGGNIVQEDMARHSIYRNVNYEFPSSFPVNPIPSLPNDSLYVLQCEESPQNNSETQSLASPYSVVHDLSMNENYSVPEADNLFGNSPSLSNRQTLTNFGAPDSGTYSNSETEMHHETVSRLQHRADVIISSNM
ncbi:hypothetical protein HNY73_010977 [Argiope bruennichi]|nr:hypothetical protein HNY73_010977 [Argiope bruennichi]